MYDDFAHHPTAVRETLATYRAIALAGRPHLSRLCMPEAEGPFLVFDRLILPLAGDGVRTDILLGIHAWEPEAGEEPAGWPPSDATVERAGDPLPGGWRVPEPA